MIQCSLELILPYSSYHLKASLPMNIHRLDKHHEEHIELKLIGYLDDTTWFSDTIDNLQKNLNIADDFYSLANIKINKEKTKLLTNDDNLLKQPSNRYNLQFGNDLVEIEIIPKRKDERILDNIILNPSTNRLQFTTQVDNMSTDLGFPRPKIIKCTNHSIPCKNQWAVFWSPRVSTIVYGKILEKSHFPGDLPKVYLEHYIPYKDMSNPNHNITPHSTSNLLTPCTGCDLHDSFYIGDVHPKCISLILQLLELRADTFKDFKMRTDPLFRNRIVTSQLITPHLYIPSNINHRLVNGLLLSNDIFNEFYLLINNLVSFTNLEFYTDGSLKIDDNNPQMGFGWIFTSDTSLNIEFSGATVQWPSSTRAGR
ncbi:unnamed protein product [Rhizophagus irregularis]|nr:unnamed protein product [Rhizophagus irregularis]